MNSISTQVFDEQDIQDLLQKITKQIKEEWKAGAEYAEVSFRVEGYNQEDEEI